MITFFQKKKDKLAKPHNLMRDKNQFIQWRFQIIVGLFKIITSNSKPTIN